MTNIDTGTIDDFNRLTGIVEQQISEAYNKQGGCPFPALPDISGSTALINVADDVWHNLSVLATAPGRPSSISQSQLNTVFANALADMQLEIRFGVDELQGQIDAAVAQEQADYKTELLVISAAGNALSDQISNLNASLGSITAGTISTAVASSNAYTDAAVRLESVERVAAQQILQTEITNNLASSQAYTVQEVRLEESQRVAAQQGLQDQIITNLAAANAYTVQQVRSEEAQRVTAEQGLQGQITAGLATVTATAITLSNQAKVDAVAQVLAQVQPTIDKITTETDTCLAPLCDTVTPNAKQLGNFGNLLNAFESAAFLALIGDLLYEAAHSPDGLVTEVQNVVGGIAESAASGLRSLIGV